MVHINFIHNKYLFALLYSNPHKSLEKKIINFIVQYKTMIKPLHIHIWVPSIKRHKNCAKCTILKLRQLAKVSLLMSKTIIKFIKQVRSTLHVYKLHLFS
jgi:hypothetical protein